MQMVTGTTETRETMTNERYELVNDSGSNPSRLTPEQIDRIAQHIDATELPDGRWAHYADETSRWYVVTAAEMLELLDYVDSEDEQVASDAYSHWCAGTSGEEMPKGWTPEHVTVFASISDGSSSDGGGEASFAADTYEAAVALAEEWARDGDYTSETEDEVSVRVAIRHTPRGEIVEWRTVAAPASRP